MPSARPSPAATKRPRPATASSSTSFWADAQNKILPDLVDFTRTFFARHTLLNILTRYCHLHLREYAHGHAGPYQITATERILNRIAIANNYKTYGTKRGGGYIWHTTGSGKTLTSFKTARLASQLPYIDKVLFVVDRKDLDYQTMKEYDRFEKGAANSNSSTAVLKRQLEDPDARIIITTIQKLSTFIKKNPTHPVYQSHVVLIFDECHRSQFGDMHKAVVTHFKKYHLFGFTGTPIFAVNAPTGGKGGMKTTAQLFGGEPDEKGNPVRPLHTYTIVDAINDHNVLPFRVDYIKTMEQEPDIDDKAVWDIDREKAFLAPKRVELVTRYILDHFDQKTYRGQRFYRFNALTNITEVAGGKQDAVEEIKNARRLSGFNSIFAVASVDLAKRYYQEFQKQMAADPTKKLRVALIYSYGANEGEADGILDEENSEDTSGLDQSGRDFLDAAIRDYNKMFRTNYSTDGDKFQNYYKDVSLRMKNKELDLLIVVNMFLTGFDATTLNTLWVDKNLKMHGLIQAFSRTNRISEFGQDLRQHRLFPQPAKAGGCGHRPLWRQKRRRHRAAAQVPGLLLRLHRSRRQEKARPRGYDRGTDQQSSRCRNRALRASRTRRRSSPCSAPSCGCATCSPPSMSSPRRNCWTSGICRTIWAGTRTCGMSGCSGARATRRTSPTTSSLRWNSSARSRSTSITSSCW